jgi:hypothetical protein
MARRRATPPKISPDVPGGQELRAFYLEMSNRKAEPATCLGNAWRDKRPGWKARPFASKHTTTPVWQSTGGQADPLFRFQSAHSRGVVHAGLVENANHIRTPCIRIVYVYYTARTGTVTA